MRERIRSRGGQFDKIVVTVVDDALGVLDDLDRKRWHTVDSTDLTVQESAAAIVAHLRVDDGTGR